ncbi:TonB-dependent receptor [Asticcacaulis sp. BYS171W]|uniref:TonB-dependent receptor n=1 Tax=Asticcacaulis aquaticus TaxID=2984212 RepID=A0ABT5HQ38_9CAUL|nr:TonB-dependent receptor [Asticcacaulis aquaticus]
MRPLRAHFLSSVAALPLLLLALPAVAQEHADHHDEDEEIEEVIVQATRAGRKLQDEPIRVEVINREEIEEKLLMTPGNIAMLVSETPGIRVQVTSPSLGSANIRMQGMLGRYTLLLTDGLPLYGGQALGLLQIPPTDLGQVEVIKGSASALYGASALGGVINLVSRRPSPELENEALLNVTSRGGQDTTGYTSAPLNDALSYSVTVGYHRQDQNDIDGDGWADMAGYERWTLRPRLFWYGDNGAKALLTVGAMTEQRDGGTVPGRTAPDGTAFVESQDTRRLDAGLNATIPVEHWGTLSLRASTMSQRHDHRFGAVTDRDHHDTTFAEAAINQEAGQTSWVAGIAWQGDRYRSKAFSGFNYDYTVPGLFAQVEQKIGTALTLAGSGRLDDHSQYGSQFSPRVSLLYRPGPWTVRASVGRGFFAPTPFVDEIEAAGLGRLEPLGQLEPEVARTASFDLGYNEGPIEANVTLFGSDIDDAVQLQETSATSVRLINAQGVTRTRGSELRLRYKWDAFSVTGSYVYVDATETDPSNGLRRDMPNTPKHTGGIVAMWEEHGKGRLGFEAYYTGKQMLEDNLYRTESKPYWELGAMGEMVFGKVSLFLNAENLLNVRQTKHNPILRPHRAADGRWTVDAWAPTEGFTLNGGVRLRF